MKKQRNIRKKPEQNLQKRRFPVLQTGKNFFGKLFSTPFRQYEFASLGTKLRKSNDKISRKSFFSNIGLRHILVINILNRCAKNQTKLMSQSREKLVTDGRTDERTNERTDGRTKVNLKDLRGRSKNKLMKKGNYRTFKRCMSESDGEI